MDITGSASALIIPTEAEQYSASLRRNDVPSSACRRVLFCLLSIPAGGFALGGYTSLLLAMAIAVAEAEAEAVIHSDACAGSPAPWRASG